MKIITLVSGESMTRITAWRCTTGDGRLCITGLGQHIISSVLRHHSQKRLQRKQTKTSAASAGNGGSVLACDIIKVGDKNRG